METGDAATTMTGYDFACMNCHMDTGNLRSDKSHSFIFSSISAFVNVIILLKPDSQTVRTYMTGLEKQSDCQAHAWLIYLSWLSCFVCLFFSPANFLLITAQSAPKRRYRCKQCYWECRAVNNTFSHC